MIRYSAEDISWFNSQIADTAAATKLNRRLDDAIAAPLTMVEIGPLDVLLLAQMNVKVAQAQAENAERDRMRCEAIRAQAYVAGKREQQAKLVRCGRALLVWLGAMALFALGMVWMVQR